MSIQTTDPASPHFFRCIIGHVNVVCTAEVYEQIRRWEQLSEGGKKITRYPGPFFTFVPSTLRSKEPWHTGDYTLMLKLLRNLRNFSDVSFEVPAQMLGDHIRAGGERAHEALGHFGNLADAIEAFGLVFAADKGHAVEIDEGAIYVDGKRIGATSEAMDAYSRS